MNKVQHSVRWEAWLANAIDEWGKAHGGKSFSDSVNYLLACELDRLGYKREFYEPGVYDPSARGPSTAHPSTRDPSTAHPVAERPPAEAAADGGLPEARRRA